MTLTSELGWDFMDQSAQMRKWKLRFNDLPRIVHNDPLIELREDPYHLNHFYFSLLMRISYWSLALRIAQHHCPTISEIMGWSITLISVMMLLGLPAHREACNFKC